VFEGAPQSLSQILDAAAAGKPPAFDLPLRATLRTVSTYDRLESPNVAGLLRGSDPRLRDEVVVYTAHLDHLGIGEPVKGDSIYNGALDNASGSAALLEVARAFASLATAPRRSVLFVAVTGEEEGLLGSDYYAEHPTVPLERIVANVNMDGLAILYPFREMSALGAGHSTLDSTVARVAGRMGVTIAPDPSAVACRRCFPSSACGAIRGWTRPRGSRNGSRRAITHRRTTSTSRWTSRRAPSRRSSISWWDSRSRTRTSGRRGRRGTSSGAGSGGSARALVARLPRHPDAVRRARSAAIARA
jgi:hypothetical protein